MIKTFKTKLKNRAQLTHDTHLFTFEIVDGQELEFTAGQYLILLVPQPDGTPARRLYSIFSSPSQKKVFDLLIKLIPNGLASGYLAQTENGKEVMFQGPAGIFTVKNTDTNRMFLATSTGLAPIWSMLQHEMEKGPFAYRTYLFWGVRTVHDAYLLEELQKMKDHSPNFTYVICLSREKDTSKIPQGASCVLGRIDKCFQNQIITQMQQANPAMLNQFDYYMCGGINAIEDLRAYLTASGVQKEHIHFEKFV